MWSAQTIKQTVEWAVIWDYMTFIWRHRNAMLKPNMHHIYRTHIYIHTQDLTYCTNECHEISFLLQWQSVALCYELWKTLIIAIWSGSEPDHSPTYKIDIDYETCNYFSHKNKLKLIEIYVYVSFNTATNTTTTRKTSKNISKLHSTPTTTPPPPMIIIAALNI